MKVTVRDIKRAVPKDLLHGVNLYPGEPTSLQHSLSVKKGSWPVVKEALEAAGLTCGHAHAFGPYSEAVWVKRSSEWKVQS